MNLIPIPIINILFPLPSPPPPRQVRAAAVFALGTYILNVSEVGHSELATSIDHSVAMTLLPLVYDGSAIVRKVRAHSLTPSASLPHTLSLTLSLPHTLSLTLSLPHTLSLTPSHPQPHSLTASHSQPHSLTPSPLTAPGAGSHTPHNITLVIIISFTPSLPHYLTPSPTHPSPTP